MRYNKNRLKEIEHSVGFYKDLLNLYYQRLEKQKMIYKPNGYATSMSYNDYDNVQTSIKEVELIEVAREIRVTEGKIQETKGIIEGYKKEIEITEKYIKLISNEAFEKVTIKEKILKLKEIELSQKDISEALGCDYRYVQRVFSS